MHNALKQLGLNEKEIKVYVASLSIGKAPVSVLSYRTGMSRNACRYICNQLIDKKIFSSERRSNNLLFKAEPPEKFQYLINQEKQEVQNKEEAFHSVLGELKSIMSPDTIIPKMKTHRGKQGIIDIYEDMINTGEDIYTWTDIAQIYETIGEYMYEFIEKRVENNITTHAIMPKTQMALQHNNEKERRNVKFVGNLPIDGEVRIYGNKIAIITLHKEQAVGFILESKLVANTMKLIFQNEWREFN